MLQGQPVQKFHGDEGFAILLADVVDGANVGVIQGGSGLGFDLKTGEGMGTAGDLFRQELEGDETVKARVFGFVDDAHPSATELFDNAVMRDGLPDH